MGDESPTSHRVSAQARAKFLDYVGGAAVELEFVALPSHTVRQNAKFGTAVLLNALRELAGSNMHPTRLGVVCEVQSEHRNPRGSKSANTAIGH